MKGALEYPPSDGASVHPNDRPASTLVLFNKNIVNFTHNYRQSQYSKFFEFFDRTFS